MPFALAIYIVFLLIESGLAWLVSGNPFLLAATSCGVLCYAAVWKWGGPWGEIVRALSAGLIAVAGPLYYKASLLPTLLCFLALPHLLAATQCFWEMALGQDPTPQNLRMRTVVFTVAFYAAMGLVFILLRGDPSLSVWMTAPLAVFVLVLAIPAWDLARVTRLKPGRSTRPVPLQVKTRRLVLLAMILGAVGAFFSGVLPAAAEKLCAVSPRWKIKADTPHQPPPRGKKPEPAPQPDDKHARRPGLDSSAMTGEHKLPQQSDIQATGETALFLRPHVPTQAQEMAKRPVYVRSHTLDEWKNDAWSPAVLGGQWLEDATDGVSDGVITLQKQTQSAESVPHTIFLQMADGYTVPALQNVAALSLPRIYAVPGDVQQMQAAGPVRYDAVSAPLNWEMLPDRSKAKAGRTGVPAQTKAPDSRVMLDLIYGNPELDPERLTTLPQRVAAVQKWLQDHIRYSTVMNGDEGLAPLDNFLIGEKRGYCDFYASAAALMLRHYGVPTRVAYGYAGKQFDSEHGVFVFTDESAHAWTEIFIEGTGWTICDFTPAENIGQLGGEKGGQTPPFDEKQFAEQKEKEPKVPEKEKPQEAFSLSEWWKETMTSLAASDPMQRAKETLTWLAVAVGLYLLWRLLWRKKKAGEGEEDRAFGEDEKQPAYFAEFVRVFQEAGCPRRQGSTPREYLNSVRGRGFGGEEFVPMMEYHYARRYEDAERDREREEAWLKLARQTEERLRQRQQQQN